jgi:hypothetical protein
MVDPSSADDVLRDIESRLNPDLLARQEAAKVEQEEQRIEARARVERYKIGAVNMSCTCTPS